MSAFTESFLVDFFQSIHKIEKNNWDHLRFTNEHPRAKNFMVDNAVYWMYAIMKNLGEYERAFELLEDDHSRALMVKLLEFDILDHHHVKLPLNTPEYWAAYNSVDEKYLLEKDALQYYDSTLNLYEIPEYDLKVYGNALTVLTQYLLKQYYYARKPVIMPEHGDVCIDAGACRGEVSLQFARSVGDTGFVYGFEFVPANIEVFNKSLLLNPDLASRIKIVPHALWQVSGNELSFVDSGPSSNVSEVQSAENGLTTTTMSIDDFVEQEGLSKVDFIKMDIEGAEANALIGAKKTIQKYKPKLAICVYHKKDDFYRIPTLIDQIYPDYAFYLDHYTIHREETVLYALPRDRNKS